VQWFITARRSPFLEGPSFPVISEHPQQHGHYQHTSTHSSTAASSTSNNPSLTYSLSCLSLKQFIICIGLWLHSPPLVCSKGTSQGLLRQRRQPKNHLNIPAGSSSQKPCPISPRAQCFCPLVVLLQIRLSKTSRFSQPIAARLSSETHYETQHHAHHSPFS